MERISAGEYVTSQMTEHDICVRFIYEYRLQKQQGALPKSIKLIKSVNEGTRSMGFVGRLKQEGWEAGTPDYSVQYSGGKCIYIEFKRSPKFILTGFQKEFQDWCDQYKVKHLVTSDWMEAIAFIKCNIPY